MFSPLVDIMVSVSLPSIAIGLPLILISNFSDVFVSFELENTTHFSICKNFQEEFWSIQFDCGGEG